MGRGRGQPQQRARIEAAIRRAFDDLQQIVGQIQFARMSLRENAEETYELLLQTQLDLAAVQKKKPMAQALQGEDFTTSTAIPDFVSKQHLHVERATPVALGNHERHWSGAVR